MSEDLTRAIYASLIQLICLSNFGVALGGHEYYEETNNTDITKDNDADNKVKKKREAS